GTLTFTPALNTNGSAVITVTVQDDGGVANGGQDTISQVLNVTVVPTGVPLLQISRDAANIRLSFPSQTGRSYAVEYKASLADGTWLTLTTVPGNGGMLTVTDALTASSRFYRVRVQ